MMIMERSRLLQLKAHALIPGGCHTYAKGDDQYPELAPRFIARGQGCHVWDADGNRFIEYGMGLRAVTLGHAFKPVVEAAHRQMLLGDNFTRPSPIEVACAERLLELLDGPEMVKFAKNGSDVTTAAVKLARAYTGRNMVAVCGDHPFFSVDDWFIGSTEMAAGIPQVVRDLTVKFRYNDIESVHTLFTQYPDRIACLVMEPERTELPRNGFLRQVQEACRANGALFILDEIITGFRVHLQGAQKLHGVTPDLATFGKGMGNGFSVSALVGRREVMRLGGLDHERERVFLLSNTFGDDGGVHARGCGRPPLPARRATGSRRQPHRRRKRFAGLLRGRGQAQQPGLLHARPGTPPLAGVPSSVHAGARQEGCARALLRHQLLAHGRGRG